jgi:ATP-dependent protease ClpP protease subunit
MSRKRYRDCNCDDNRVSNKKRKDWHISENGIYAIGNEIHFSTPVEKLTIQEVIRLMSTMIHEHKEKFKDKGEPDPLKIVYIVDTPGGDVSAVLKFVDFISIAKQKNKFVEFISIISGTAASAGTTMSIIADKRYMTKNAYAMIHELSTGSSGKYTELMSYAKHLENVHTRMVKIYCDVTKKSKEEIEGLLRKETWFCAEDYLKFGFVDEIK